jgi:predicted SAM-dependent methyltransferase
VLKVGGVLRVAVPDFAVLAKLYVQGIPIHQIRGPVIGRHHELYNGHKALFDFSNLAAAMTAAGFSDIHRYNWRTTEHADIDDYSQAYIPHMDKEYGTLISLNVEGVKCLRT